MQPYILAHPSYDPPPSAYINVPTNSRNITDSSPDSSEVDDGANIGV